MFNPTGIPSVPQIQASASIRNSWFFRHPFLGIPHSGHVPVRSSRSRISRIRAARSQRRQPGLRYTLRAGAANQK
jgi:hypothetical protein